MGWNRVLMREVGAPGLLRGFGKAINKEADLVKQSSNYMCGTAQNQILGGQLVWWSFSL